MKKFVLTFEIFDDNEHSNKKPSMFRKTIYKIAYYLDYSYIKIKLFLKKIFSYIKENKIGLINFAIIITAFAILIFIFLQFIEIPKESHGYVGIDFERLKNYREEKGYSEIDFDRLKSGDWR